jgi:hypothetical protein
LLVHCGGGGFVDVVQAPLLHTWPRAQSASLVHAGLVTGCALGGVPVLAHKPPKFASVVHV